MGGNYSDNNSKNNSNNHILLIMHLFKRLLFNHIIMVANVLIFGHVIHNVISSSPVGKSSWVLSWEGLPVACCLLVTLMHILVIFS